MQVLILNSGVGRRLHPLTSSKPKAFVELSYGESIIHRQLRLLSRLNVNEVIITTGPFQNQFESLKVKYPRLNITLVHNPLYESSNSIYSLFLVKEYIKQDTIIMHGDVVFSFSTLKKLFNCKKNSVLVDASIPKDYKDFLARVENGFIQEINVQISTDSKHVYSLKPIYKLSKEFMIHWFIESQKIIETVGQNEYAEIAMKNLFSEWRLTAVEFENSYAEEIDDHNDLIVVSESILNYDYLDQEIIYSNDYYKESTRFLDDYNVSKPLLVHGKHFLKNSEFLKFITDSGVTIFNEFTPNPSVDEVREGILLFNQSSCDSVIALGGGSAIDTAKAIKLGLEESSLEYLQARPHFNNLPLLAIPSTAGTGSESTRYSVIYDKDVKLSLSHHSLFPNRAVLSTQLLLSVPLYHKNSSLMDVITQAIESIWSKNANNASLEYATEALKIISKYLDRYLYNDELVFDQIIKASNLAGKAINITATTAPHALSYLLTKKYGIAHGHAVAICMPGIIQQLSNFTNVNQKSNLNLMIKKICDSLFLDSIEDLELWFKSLLERMKLESNVVQPDDIDYLIQGVNLERLNNHPIKVTSKDILRIYTDIQK